MLLPASVAGNNNNGETLTPSQASQQSGPPHVPAACYNGGSASLTMAAVLPVQWRCTMYSGGRGLFGTADGTFRGRSVGGRHVIGDGRDATERALLPGTKRAMLLRYLRPTLVLTSTAYVVLTRGVWAYRESRRWTISPYGSRSFSPRFIPTATALRYQLRYLPTRPVQHKLYRRACRTSLRAQYPLRDTAWCYLAIGAEGVHGATVKNR
eukprot:3693619-Rhodomonas_salina.2